MVNSNNRSISQKEENELYQIINDSLFALCEEKPSDPIEFLSIKMLQEIGDTATILEIKSKVIFISTLLLV